MRAFCDICRVELWAFPGVCEQCVRSGLGFDVGFYLAREDEVIMGAWVLLALLLGAANLTRHKHIGDTRTLSRLRQDGWLGAALLALALGMPGCLVEKGIAASVSPSPGAVIASVGAVVIGEALWAVCCAEERNN